MVGDRFLTTFPRSSGWGRSFVWRRHQRGEGKYNFDRRGDCRGGSTRVPDRPGAPWRVVFDSEAPSLPSPGLRAGFGHVLLAPLGGQRFRNLGDWGDPMGWAGNALPLHTEARTIGRFETETILRPSDSAYNEKVAKRRRKSVSPPMLAIATRRSVCDWSVCGGETARPTLGSTPIDGAGSPGGRDG